MQISELVLIGFKGQVRRLRFRLGAVNIITGAAKTGKSALIPIIDYCLGAKECSVPIGAIREAVEWYGAILQFSDCQALILRKTPDAGQNSSASYFFEVADEVGLPSRTELTSNSNEQGILDFLSVKLGISPNLTEPGPKDARHPSEATLRHALFYAFQPQYEIGHPNHVFHRQSDQNIHLAMKDTLPYFLGACGEDRLRQQHELSAARELARRLERDILEAESLLAGGFKRARALLAEARTAGLVSVTQEPSDVAETFQLLRAAASWRSSDGPVTDTAPGAGDAEQLANERRELLERRRSLEDELRAARTFMREQAGFSSEAQEQEVRLECINLFRDLDQHPVPGAEVIRQALTKLSGQLERVTRQRPQLERYINGIERRLRSLNDELALNQDKLRGLQQASENLRRFRDEGQAKAIVAGRVGLYVESVGLEHDIPAMRERLRAAQASVTVLEEALDKDQLEETLRSQELLIGERMTMWARKLNLEHSEHPVRLDTRKVDAIVHRPTGPVSLRKVGAGENWVGYHVITHLALHEWFVKRGRPVPRFLILDQPSQSQYPQDLHSQGGIAALAKDEDREAVHRLFGLIFEVTEQLSPAFQVIVTDHAELHDEKFQAAIVERWRGLALVPTDWV